MADLNFTIMQGRLTADPTTSTNGATSFSIACDDFKGNASFFKCVAFKETGTFIGKYFKKGSSIIIEGRLSQSVYEKDGQKRESISIIVSAAHFCGSGKQNNAQEASAPASEKKTQAPKNESSEIDFVSVDDDDFPYI